MVYIYVMYRREEVVVCEGVEGVGVEDDTASIDRIKLCVDDNCLVLYVAL
jgi:hypothetical protein